ncbi:unnamed protein product [Prorocentrum cordatum]|uniref:CSD domain-containing protein n=1 Tax=Prorocentrum cordatum TaxID=2364126 RepID=A0ABN9YBT8_9DINO|nr:unnamed protein product [Polarella glacialis]|mmetsp:Transcript_90180/g.234760  ORF Transcript_90180/g.234760 Transcript_90180/m.234760 type:complete len:122 (-) Transcript_90180:76-441(-)
MGTYGVLKRWFEDKGFGFVTPDDGSEDVFVHVKDNPVLQNCHEGDKVRFDQEWDDRKNKMRGVNVTTSAGDGGGYTGNSLNDLLDLVKGKGKGDKSGGPGGGRGFDPYHDSRGGYLHPSFK